MRASTVFLVACIAVAVSMTGYDWMVRPMIDRIVYDDRSPVSFLDARLEQTQLRSGEPIRFQFTYTKRAACGPPMAPAGLIKFRVWLNAHDWIWLSQENRSYAPPTAQPAEMPLRAIPMPPLAPGRYIFQWQGEYRCSGSSRPIVAESPKLPFEIIE